MFDQTPPDCPPPICLPPDCPPPDGPPPRPALPPLPALLARSTYAGLILAISSLSAALGVDLFGSLGQLAGIDGLTGEELLASIDPLIAALAGLWLWAERRSPRFRITVMGKG
jgi:hypothetical protein